MWKFRRKAAPPAPAMVTRETRDTQGMVVSVPVSGHRTANITMNFSADKAGVPDDLTAMDKWRIAKALARATEREIFILWLGYAP